jgi:hypothetical protein
MMVGSTSSTSNVHEVVDDNSHCYRSIVMDVVRMNQVDIGECFIIDKEPNIDAARFLYLLKDFNKPLWDGCTNHSKLLVIIQVFTIKSNHGLTKASYEKNHQIDKKHFPLKE